MKPSAFSFDLGKFDPFRNELRKVSLVADHIAHGGRRDVGIFLGGRDDDSVDLGSKMPVCICNRLLIVEVRHVADSPDDVLYTKLTADVHGKAVVTYDPDPLQVLSGLGYDVLALLHGEKAFFSLVDSNGHDYLVEDREGPGKDVQMA